MRCPHCTFRSKSNEVCDLCKSVFQKEVAVKVKVKRFPKVKDLPAVIKALDEVFSKYIRLRFADENGIVKCFTSGKIMHWKQSQAGHFISRRHLATRWDEVNVQVQSVAENVFNQGNAPAFAEKIKEVYGPEALEELHRKKSNKWKPSKFELELLIAIYKNKIENL
jgi:hypothetical protein